MGRHPGAAPGSRGVDQHHAKRPRHGLQEVAQPAAAQELERILAHGSGYQHGEVFTAGGKPHAAAVEQVCEPTAVP